MNEQHHPNRSDGRTVAPGWIIRSGVDRRTHAVAQPNLPSLRVGALTHQCRRASDDKSYIGAADTEASAESRYLSDIEVMEKRARSYLATAEFYVQAGVQQLRVLASLRNLEAMRKFKMKSLALRTEIASKHMH